MASVYRPEFEAAPRMFAKASSAMVSAGYEAPILVGGGAVEFFSASALTTGDFDVSTARQDIFEQTLGNLGFVKPSGREIVTKGWVHPELALGFEVVSSSLLDGLADRDRVALVDFGPDGMAKIIAVEDIVADRMGQFASGTAPEMRGQAASLLVLHNAIDRAYLDGAYARKQWAIMASTTSRDPIPFEEYAAYIERRRQETGITDLPRNAGNRRTASKRALLKAIEDAGGKW